MASNDKIPGRCIDGSIVGDWGLQSSWFGGAFESHSKPPGSAHHPCGVQDRSHEPGVHDEWRGTHAHNTGESAVLAAGISTGHCRVRSASFAS